MRTDDFNFDLPEELIAQHPLEQRDHSRLLVLDKHSGNITHKRFDDILDYRSEEHTLNSSHILISRMPSSA